MRVRNHMASVGVILCLCTINSQAQQSMFDLFKSERSLANQYFEQGDLKAAVRLYQQSKAPDAKLMLARSYYRLKEYQNCIEAYDAYKLTGTAFTVADYHRYAEASLTLKRYDQALDSFQKILKLEPDNHEVVRKLWRISNIHYLYEDSIHFATRLLTINTPHGEWGGVAFRNGLLFLSNRPSRNPVKQVDAATHQPFYRIYTAKEKPDTLLDGWSRLYGKPGLYEKAPSVTGNAAGFCIYDKGTKMIFTASSSEKNTKGERTLGLYFAELKNNKWKLIEKFEHNSTEWSVTDPAIDTVHHVLYFASDKPGGKGRMDLYRSQLSNNHWTKPDNVGEGINTSSDEIFPYFHQGMLYFSSNGQPGMGGLDLFRIDISGNQSEEPVNLGYPMNSPYDDFSITFTDTKGNHGFLSSNRKQGGLDDDIYEFDMDMQTYPFEITGIVKQMDHTWVKDSSQTQILKNAKILLVDNIRNITVQETNSDASGAFSLKIPYFSKYAVRVIDSDGVENIVVFDIPRQRKESTVHEIVVVKDIFQTITR